MLRSPVKIEHGCRHFPSGLCLPQLLSKCVTETGSDLITQCDLISHSRDITFDIITLKLWQDCVHFILAY